MRPHLRIVFGLGLIFSATSVTGKVGLGTTTVPNLTEGGGKAPSQGGKEPKPPESAAELSDFTSETTPAVNSQGKTLGKHSSAEGNYDAAARNEINTTSAQALKASSDLNRLREEKKISEDDHLLGQLMLTRSLLQGVEAGSSKSNRTATSAPSEASPARTEAPTASIDGPGFELPAGPSEYSLISPNNPPAAPARDPVFAGLSEQIVTPDTIAQSAPGNQDRLVGVFGAALPAQTDRSLLGYDESEPKRELQSESLDAASEGQPGLAAGAVAALEDSAQTEGNGLSKMEMLDKALSLAQKKKGKADAAKGAAAIARANPGANGSEGLPAVSPVPRIQGGEAANNDKGPGFLETVMDFFTGEADRDHHNAQEAKRQLQSLSAYVARLSDTNRVLFTVLHFLAPFATGLLAIPLVGAIRRKRKSANAGSRSVKKKSKKSV